MRPTGPLHVGHLVGALQNWVSFQDTHECFFAIVDWHALTTEYANSTCIRPYIREVALDYLAAGIDPETSTVFVQSSVKEHAELHLLLSMLVPIPWLERVPTYKEQQEALSDRDLSSYGFLGYPLLQSADILIYKATAVPVGEDQVPHVELCREVARRFNKFYGPVFPEPRSLLTPTPRLPGTDARKMSKSYGNAIYLSDSPEIVAKRVDDMITDPARTHRHIPGNPDLCTVYAFHKVFSAAEEVRWADQGCRTAGIGCRDCKSALKRSLQARLTPFSERRQALAAEPERVARILRDGAARARTIASATMAEVRAAIGLD